MYNFLLLNINMLKDNIDGYFYTYDCISLHDLNTSENKIPKISIIICSFNSPIELIFCLKAAESSNYKNKEFIVVDDSNSFIPNEEILKFNFPIKYIKLHSKSWINKHFNFNIGIKFSTGSIIMLQSSLVIPLGDTVTFIKENMEPNTIIQLPILKLKRKKDNNNLIYNLFNKKNSCIIRNIVSKDKKVFIYPSKSERYELQYHDDECNFIIAIHRHNLSHSSQFDLDLDILHADIFSLFIHKLKCMNNINTRVISFTPEYNLDKIPYGMALYKELPIETISNHSDNKKISDTDKELINYEEVEASESSSDSVTTNNIITIDILNKNQLIKIKEEFYLQKFKKQYKFIEGNIYNNLIRLPYHKFKYELSAHSNMDKYTNNLFDIISYNEEDDSFHYAVKDKLTRRQTAIIFKSGIIYEMYNHNVENEKYKITFDCKSNNEQTNGKKMAFYNTSKWIVFPNKLTSSYQSYSYAFEWKGIVLGPGKYENYFKLIVSKLISLDSFSIKNLVLVQL